MTLLFTLTLTVLLQRNTRLLSFLCCCSLYFSDTECPPYDLVLRTDGSVSFPFGKDGFGMLANCSLCGIEATLFFSAAPVCLNISARACAILHALCWSRQHQQVCHFSSLLLLSDSRSVLATLFSPSSFLLPQSLSEVVFSLLQFYQATMGPRPPDTRFFRTTTRLTYCLIEILRHTGFLDFHRVTCAFTSCSL